MRSQYLKTVKTAILAISVLLLGASLSLAQVNLGAGPAAATLPDGTSVPMWGYTCGAVTGTATCAALNTSGSWSPVIITVPSGQDLQINLTNNLVFGANKIPTSLVIVGQLGGGLGDTTQRTTTSSPTHASQSTTWPIANAGATNTPPAQGPRVQSFSTEVAGGASSTSPLVWKAPRPGTYLLESGTHPSIQGAMGLYGIVVVTTAPTAPAGGAQTPGTAYSGVPYNAEIPLLFSEIDPVQNNAVNIAVNSAGFSETAVWSGQPGGCGNPASPTFGSCYPPAVNYKPLYYLINGLAFNKTNASASLFAATPGSTASPVSGSVLVRLVNAGLRMHVPSIVGSQVGNGTPVSGLALIAEDGNPLPGVPRVQNEVFLAAGKTYDVMINVPTGTTALPIYDRELSLSANATARDSGMLAYISVNGAGLPGNSAFTAAIARNDQYNSVVSGKSLTVSDPGQGVIANDTNVFGVQLLSAPTGGTVTLNRDGTFSYVANAGTTSDSFTYCANGSVTAAVCSSGLTATVTLGAATLEGASGITLRNDQYSSNVAASISIAPPGVLGNDTDAAGYPLSAIVASAPASLNLKLNGDGSFTARPTGAGGAACPTGTPAGANCFTFTYSAKNSQGTPSTSTATVTLAFLSASGLKVTVLDGADKATKITDYRWIIEEDRTFFVDPTTTTNSGTVPPTFGVNFHTSYMPLVATGCTGALSCESGQTWLNPATGQHELAVCDIGNGVCRTDTVGTGQAVVMPSQVHLDPTKRYYISILPGDAGNPFGGGYVLPPSCVASGGNSVPSSTCGHGMSGAPIAAGQAAVTILSQPSPYQTSKLSVFVFEDDFPLNGENDAGGGIDTLSPNEPGLGGFNITLFDDAGGTGDATGQMTYDMFNMPLGNSLSGTTDPSTGMNACPISVTTDSITGTIVTCPEFESDGLTHSPLRGQAVVANLMPGRYGVVATPAADRIARGEEWLQTNTLDGQKAHDSFLRVGEPSYFQEFGPAGYHVSIGFANPTIINSRYAGVCGGTDVNITGTDCTHTVMGRVTTERMSRTPDERLYSSGSNDSFAFTQCYVSFGDPDGEDFAFAKCNSDGTFSLSNLPAGNWRITVFDQWNDMLVDGLSTPVGLGSGFSLCSGTGSTSSTCNLGDIAMNQWQANIYTATFFDQNGNGVRDNNEPGLTLVATNIRFRDGSYSNFNNTDLNGNAGFNEVFPLFSWYVVETDTTRYKSTGIHVVYDAGGPADGTTCGPPATAPCGNSSIAGNYANTYEQVPVPANLHVPGSVYCNNADCTGQSIKDGPSSGTPNSTARIDAPWVPAEGWQGFSGQNSFLEFGKAPFAVGENGGIHGEVTYASTRPFDDPTLLLHTSWTPNVPGVTINLYQESTAPDGSQSLTLVDTTKTTSWDDWAQGFRSDGIPNMNCPGQATTDLFYFSLLNQPNYLNVYNSQHGGPAATALPNNSQFKCYDGMHNWNQLQPAPYDGMYSFPSVTSTDPVAGKPTGTNCTICVTDPDSNDAYRYGGSTTPVPWTAGKGAPMLPAGKYVVEMMVPPGYELVKEEDKNILIGDNYIAPVTQEFGGLGSIFILPDQAEVRSLYNANNPQNPTGTLGRTLLPSHEGDTGSIETFWPCVGALRVVPDYISLFPQSKEVSPFAGASRNLCDRKEVQLDDQTSVLAKFWIFTSTHAAAHYTGVITDDFTSEFDPFSPQFGEKFAPPDLPISIKDFSGNEVSRTYADHWGAYNGLNYSTWEVNPPNPTGYAPTMMVTCMNDPGPILDTNQASLTYNQLITDPLYNPQYSQFCYEIPFMPGQTQYMDTPVVPTAAFAGAGYNNPDCAYPTLTPAISEVDGDGVGPYISATGTTHPITILALGDQMVNNYGYSGPSATKAPFNQKKASRHYGFGATKGTIQIGGTTVPAANITTWTDSKIVLNLPNGFNVAVSACPIRQQGIYQGSAAQCGQMDIVTSTGQHSIDTVTVTIGGKAPSHVAASGSIQSAIDKALPGDLIIIDPTCTTSTGVAEGCTKTDTHAPAAHNEMVLMWKPIRLQGVGAASSIINANAHPAGKMDPWRRQVDCLFGMAMDGTPISGTNPYDANGTFMCSGAGQSSNPLDMNFQVDRLPLEATVGWDATLNGNLAELLQEPTLMGAYEGAGITVVAKGVDYHGGNPYAADTFPAGTTLLTSRNCLVKGKNPFPSNFQCNPSSIDGLEVTDSSQGGGGIFVHAWAHNLQIANNRINSNTGTLSGGISIGQGEFPPQYLAGGVNPDPGSCQSSGPMNTQLPYCFNLNVNVHNNNISSNNTLGDELFSATPSGAGGVAFCTGADFYKFQYNWVCGNLSTGDGGGLVHIGFSYNGDIEHNAILFNQSTNPTISTNGGGIAILGAPDTDPVCGTAPDGDCPPGVSDGTGPGLVINANLVMGNAAESGSGGGIRLQGLNGTELTFFPTQPWRWNAVKVTNNIITNNVAGWDGAGVSLQDALAVKLINNTIASNDTTASAGVLFNTLGAPIASSQGPCPANTQPCVTTSTPQPAGLVAIQNSPVLMQLLNPPAPAAPVALTCPSGQPGCRNFSSPLLANNLFWQNRAFHITVNSAPASGPQNQQNVVALVPTLNQTSTGQCINGASYWDLGVRGDTSTAPGSGPNGYKLNPTHSILTSTSGYGASNLQPLSTPVLAQYCNGSRIPPENGGMGYQVPPGISDATVPNPVFNLTPAATVDEGNNWINVSWGPLALTNPNNGNVMGNYGIGSGSPAIDAADDSVSPSTDYFGNTRPQGAEPDIGAVEFLKGPAADLDVTPLSLGFSTVTINQTSAPQFVTLTNSGSAVLTGVGGGAISVTFSSPRFARATGFGLSQNCGASLAVGASCRIYVTFTPTATAPVAATMTINTNDASADAATDRTVQLSGAGTRLVVSPSGLNFLTLGSGFSAAQTVTVSNPGPGSIPGPFGASIANVTNGVTFQIQSNTCPTTASGLTAGANCQIRVRFQSPTPLTIGTGTLNITEGEPATVLVGLTGTRLF